MTEKLSEYEITSRDGDFINVDCNTKIINTLVRKINELVDAVNTIQTEREAERFEIQEWIAIVSDLRSRMSVLEEHAHPTAKTPADPYAEQRKWAGKLCRFWDENKDRAIYDILEEVIANWSYQFRTKSDYVFDHCEPVLPDDDIIYKGGKNE